MTHIEFSDDELEVILGRPLLYALRSPGGIVGTLYVRAIDPISKTITLGSSSEVEQRTVNAPVGSSNLSSLANNPPPEDML